MVVLVQVRMLTYTFTDEGRTDDNEDSEIRHSSFFLKMVEAFFYLLSFIRYDGPRRNGMMTKTAMLS